METPNNHAGRATERIMVRIHEHIKPGGLNPGEVHHYNRAYEAVYTEIRAVYAEIDALCVQRDDLLALVKEASEIMTITYAGNFPAGIESFLVRASETDALLKGVAGA